MNAPPQTPQAHTPVAQSAFGTPKRYLTLRALWRAKKPPRAEGHREAPVLVRLDPLPGRPPSGKPPVRIFLGSEPEQYRAERVFVWSVLQVRDPARAYEIYLMKDLAGYDRRKWTTGFTNYRYAIPLLAGGQGRAIYNDVDQIYLGDPAELFDRDMGGAALLAINQQETSVMLLDCARLAALWDVDEARRLHNHRHFRGAVLERGAWGLMPGLWNARDFEYVAGESKLLHYTTLYKQPWRPFPEQYRYRENPLGRLWQELERQADAAGFTPFTQQAPSAAFLALQQGGETRPQLLEPVDLAWHGRQIARLAAGREATLLELGDSGFGRAHAILPLLAAGRQPAGEGPAGEGPAGMGLGPAAGALALGSLEALPEEDIPWALDLLFRLARDFVYVAATVYGPEATGHPETGDGPATRLPRKWWLGQLELAARRQPGKAWVLALRDAGRDGWRLHRSGR